MPFGSAFLNMKHDEYVTGVSHMREQVSLDIGEILDQCRIKDIIDHVGLAEILVEADRSKLIEILKEMNFEIKEAEEA